eukprot:jgi/Mesvir1/17118/Mv07551-RA.1
MPLTRGGRQGYCLVAPRPTLLAWPFLYVILVAVGLTLTTFVANADGRPLASSHRRRSLLLSFVHPQHSNSSGPPSPPSERRRSRPTMPPEGTSPAEAEAASTALPESQNHDGAFAVQSFVKEALASSDPELARLYDVSRLTLEQLFQNRTIEGKDYVFTSTGDIPAMWIRDSTAEVAIYFRDLSANAGHLRVATGLLRAQILCLTVDQYANACRLDFLPRAGESLQDIIFGRSGWVFTDNFELDSVAYFFRLARRVYDATASEPARRDLFDERFWSVVRKLLSVLRREQNHEAYSSYEYPGVRGVSQMYPELAREGRGLLTGFTGMVWSGFRASDEPQMLGYHIPANMMLAVELRSLSNLAARFLQSSPPGSDDHDAGAVAAQALALAGEIDAGIRNHAVVNTTRFGPIWAYEVDGLGNAITIDDANVPSLLSIPVLGYVAADDPMYVSTRRFVLTASTNGIAGSFPRPMAACADATGNPYYYESNERNQRGGPRIAGVGSSHTSGRFVWPMALITQARTLNPRKRQDRAELAGLLDMIKRGGIPSGLPESFNVDTPSMHTRQLFGWVDALFMELMDWLVLDTGFFLPQPPAPPATSASPSAALQGGMGVGGMVGGGGAGNPVSGGVAMGPGAGVAGTVLRGSSETILGVPLLVAKDPAQVLVEKAAREAAQSTLSGLAQGSSAQTSGPLPVTRNAGGGGGLPGPLGGGPVTGAAQYFHKSGSIMLPPNFPLEVLQKLSPTALDALFAGRLRDLLPGVGVGVTQVDSLSPEPYPPPDVLRLKAELLALNFSLKELDGLSPQWLEKLLDSARHAVSVGDDAPMTTPQPGVEKSLPTKASPTAAQGSIPAGGLGSGDRAGVKHHANASQDNGRILNDDEVGDPAGPFA